MIPFGLAKSVAIDAYMLADNIRRHFNDLFSELGISEFDVFTPNIVLEKYVVWEKSDIGNFQFDNLSEMLLLTYDDMVPADTTGFLGNVGKGGNYLIEYPFGSVAAFYLTEGKEDFIETLSRDTGIEESLCENLWPITFNKPFSMLPCGTYEISIKFRDRDIFLNLIAYAKIINDLPQFTDKRIIFFGGKPHAEFFVNNIKKLYPDFPDIVKFSCYNSEKR